jgi:hypothetical protein
MRNPAIDRALVLVNVLLLAIAVAQLALLA